MYLSDDSDARLRVVPHFSSGTVERAKRERAFTRARVSLALLSLRKNGGLLVVYSDAEWIVFWLLCWRVASFFKCKLASNKEILSDPIRTQEFLSRLRFGSVETNQYQLGIDPCLVVARVPRIVVV